MTKSDALIQLREALASQAEVMKSALADSNESATGDETKSEGKYDTRAVEASYLAQAQEEQLTALEEATRVFTNFEPPQYEITDEIGIGALVEVEQGDEIQFYFLAPVGGGASIDYLGCDLTVITPESRLYQDLLGKRMGEEIENPPLLVTGIE